MIRFMFRGGQTSRAPVLCSPPIPHNTVVPTDHDYVTAIGLKYGHINKLNTIVKYETNIFVPRPNTLFVLKYLNRLAKRVMPTSSYFKVTKIYLFVSV